MEDSINGSDYGILNWDSPTRVPPNAEPSSPDVSLASASLITSCSWQTLSTLSSDHLPILIRLQMKTPANPGLRRTYVNLKKANWDRYRQEVEAALSKCSLPTYCQRDENIFRTVLLKAASHHIPTGRHRLHEEAVPAEILDVMNRRGDLRKRDPTSPEAENEASTFNGISFSSFKQLATKFNQQFNTSKLGRHTSSRETRVVTRKTKRKPLEKVQTFTTDLVMKAIKSCRNGKAFGPNSLSIFHLGHLGPRAIEHITALFNLSATTCRIPAIWKSSLIIPMPKPGKDTSQGTYYRPISLICPAAKVLESINKYLIPAQDQHGFRREHSTTSALLQLTTDVAVGFNQRKPPERTVCVAVDLSAALVQFAMATYYQKSTDLSSLRPLRDGSPVI